MKGVGYNYTPTILQQGNTVDSLGQAFSDKLGGKKDAGKSIYDTMKQQNTSRLANDLIQKSAGLKLDEFGNPNLNLTDFSGVAKNQIGNIGHFGDLATQTAEAKNAYQTAVTTQNIGSYGFSSYAGGTSGSVIPGATAGNKGAQAAAMAMQVQKNGTPYQWGGNSLSQGVDCSGLVQQIYGKLGISLPRTTYEQAKFGKQVSVNQIRPGDLVFYNKYGHVGIYVGNGHIVHSANSRLGVITSNLTNSNGAPLLVLRPY